MIVKTLWVAAASLSHDTTQNCFQHTVYSFWALPNSNNKKKGFQHQLKLNMNIDINNSTRGVAQNSGPYNKQCLWPPSFGDPHLSGVF